MRRRTFMTLSGGAAAGWPLDARCAGSNTNTSDRRRRTRLRRGLTETGYSEGRNVIIEYRWADGQNDRLPAMLGSRAERNCEAVHGRMIKVACRGPGLNVGCGEQYATSHLAPQHGQLAAAVPPIKPDPFFQVPTPEPFGSRLLAWPSVGCPYLPPPAHA